MAGKRRAFGTKLRRNIEKFASPSIHPGLNTHSDWISVGNFSMNKLLSGSYYNAFMFGRSVLIGGESGSGKSLVLASAAAQAQKEHDAFILWIDVEEATTYEWLHALGVDTSSEMFESYGASTMGDVKKIISEVVKESEGDTSPYDEKRKVMIVVDSWSDLLTEKEFEEAKTGKMVGDQGQAAKQLKNIIKAAGHLIARKPIIVAGVVHTMESQDKYDPDEKFLGGRGLIYLASLAFLFTKMKLKGKHLKEFDGDYEGDDAKVVGNRAKVKLYKSRFTKPNEEVEVQMVYPNGLDPYSGLFDYMKEDGLIVTAPGNGRYSVEWPKDATPPTDFPESFTKKQFMELADTIMKAVESDPEAPSIVMEEEPSDEV